MVREDTGIVVFQKAFLEAIFEEIARKSGKYPSSARAPAGYLKGCKIFGPRHLHAPSDERSGLTPDI